MARKRMVDPEFWLDEDITSMSFECRLFYIGTWNFADDYGVIENSAKKLKAQVFPYDDVDCQKIIDKLIKLNKLVSFISDGKEWLYIRKFLKYQRVDKPSKYRNPPAPKGILAEDSTTTQEPLNDEVKRSEEKLSKENIELPLFLNKKAWEAWVQHRKEKKKQLTPTTIKMQLRFLEENKEDHVQIIKNSITNGWIGLFTIKINTQRKTSRYVEPSDSKEINDRRTVLAKQTETLASNFKVK